MGPREQDNDMLLLGMVTLICATLAGVVELAQPGPAIAESPAAATRPTMVAGAAPVRVILPFNPNTTPSAR